MEKIEKDTLNKLINAYIFLALYRAEMIKSKSFSFSKDGSTLNNKILHILKSKFNKVLSDEQYRDIFLECKFSYNLLKIRFNFIDTKPYKHIMSGFCQKYFSRLDVLQSFSIINFYNSELHISLTNYLDIYNFENSNYGLDYNDSFNLKQVVDRNVNGILYLHNVALGLILDKIMSIKLNFDNNEEINLYDFCLFSQGYHSYQSQKVRNFIISLNQYIDLNEDILSNIKLTGYSYNFDGLILGRYDTEQISSLENILSLVCQNNGIILNENFNIIRIENPNFIINNIEGENGNGNN